MVPAAYVRLESLPLTANGKIDRKALPAPDGDAYVTRGYQAPQGEVEQSLARIWSEVLKLDRVGRHDDFFELGGHSLLAVQVVSRDEARDAWRGRGPAELFAHPVLRELAAQVARSAPVDAQPILAVSRSGSAAARRRAQQRSFLVHVAVPRGRAARIHIPSGVYASRGGAGPCDARWCGPSRASWSATRRCARGSCRWTGSLTQVIDPGGPRTVA